MSPSLQQGSVEQGKMEGNGCKIIRGAPTTDRDDNEIEELYDQLHSVIDQTPKKDILLVQGGWNVRPKLD